MSLSEHVDHHGLKVLERLGVVLRVEGLLVVLISEAFGEVVPRLATMLLAQVGIHTEVFVVVAALEVLMERDHAVDLVAHVGLQDLSRDFGMVGYGDQLADVVQQRGDDDLLIRAIALGSGGGLEGVLHLIDRKAVADIAQSLDHREDLAGDTGLRLDRALNDLGPLLTGRDVHARKRCHRSILPGGLYFYRLSAERPSAAVKSRSACPSNVERSGVCNTRSTTAEMAFSISRNSGGGGKYSSSM